MIHRIQCTTTQRIPVATVVALEPKRAEPSFAPRRASPATASARAPVGGR